MRQGAAVQSDLFATPRQYVASLQGRRAPASAAWVATAEEAYRVRFAELVARSGGLDVFLCAGRRDLGRCERFTDAGEAARYVAEAEGRGLEVSIAA